ncbi:MAG: thiol-disulfide oxidoreductase DCC family protein [Haloferacaceae archaeon]
MPDVEAVPSSHPVLLFDGVCNLCNAAVQFVLARDPGGVFRFASLQSEVGERLLDAYDVPAGDLETVVLLDGDDYYLKSDAAIRAAELLGGPYALAAALRVVPRPIRDAGYDLVAASRYRVFGRRDRCMVPEADVSDRFLDG